MVITTMKTKIAPNRRFSNDFIVPPFSVCQMLFQFREVLQRNGPSAPNGGQSLSSHCFCQAKALQSSQLCSDHAAALRLVALVGSEAVGGRSSLFHGKTCLVKSFAEPRWRLYFFKPSSG